MRTLAMSMGLMLVCQSAVAQVDAPDHPVCVKAARLSIPAADEPGRVEKARLKGCGPLALYFGMGQPANARKARACAYIIREQDRQSADQSGGDDIEAPAVLTMIYAGGHGVAPDLGLAEKFACELRGGWDDGTPIAEELDAQRAAGAHRFELDVCKSPPGRWTNYACIVRDQTWADSAVKREERLAAAAGSGETRMAFARLRRARTAYLTAHDPELPNGNTGLVQEAMREAVDETRHWLQLLREANAGKGPAFTEDQFRIFDTKLNAAYRSWLTTARASGSGNFGDPTEDQSRIAERAWLRYREAWVAYGRLRAPEVDADRWRAALTAERTEFLGGS